MGGWRTNQEVEGSTVGLEYGSDGTSKDHSTRARGTSSPPAPAGVGMPPEAPRPACVFRRPRQCETQPLCIVGWGTIQPASVPLIPQLPRRRPSYRTYARTAAKRTRPALRCDEAQCWQQHCPFW